MLFRIVNVWLGLVVCNSWSVLVRVVLRAVFVPVLVILVPFDFALAPHRACWSNCVCVTVIEAFACAIVFSADCAVLACALAPQPERVS